jgi:hypothetical protein
VQIRIFRPTAHMCEAQHRTKLIGAAVFQKRAPGKEESAIGFPDKWMRLAPEPRELTNGEQWHVFLSYRSVNRSWVLNLYDVLREVGLDLPRGGGQISLTPPQPPPL